MPLQNTPPIDPEQEQSAKIALTRSLSRVQIIRKCEEYLEESGLDLEDQNDRREYLLSLAEDYQKTMRAILSVIDKDIQKG